MPSVEKELLADGSRLETVAPILVDQFVGLALGDYRVQAGNERYAVLVYYNHMPARSFVILGSVNEHYIAIFEQRAGRNLLQRDVELGDVLIIDTRANARLRGPVDVTIVEVAVAFRRALAA